MADESPRRPDHRCLFEAASTQGGYFTSVQARACGFGWDLLSHQVRKGRYFRLRRGLYRLRDYPTSPHEEVIAAWLAVGAEVGLVSHESALDLLGLSDVIPNAVHITVPRSHRSIAPSPGTTIHTTTRKPDPDEVIIRGGVRLTNATRSILDAAEAGTAPEQIIAAVRQAVRRGLATRRGLLEKAAGRGKRVQRLILRALDEEST